MNFTDNCGIIARSLPFMSGHACFTWKQEKILAWLKRRLHFLLCWSYCSAYVFCWQVPSTATFMGSKLRTFKESWWKRFQSLSLSGWRVSWKNIGRLRDLPNAAVPARPGCLCLFFELHLTPAPASFKMLHRKVTRSSSSHTCANPDSWFTILSSCQQRCLCPVLLPFPKQSFPFVSSFLVFPVNFVLFCFFFCVCVCVALTKCLPSLLWSDSCYRRCGNFCPNRWGMTSIYFYATFFTNLFEWKQKTLV